MDKETIFAEKKALRARMKAVLRDMPAEAFQAAGEKVAEQVTSYWGLFNRILCFMAMDGEIDTGAIIEKAFAGGKALYLPKVTDDEMRFYRLRPPDGTGDPNGPLVTGAYGIREPQGRAADLFVPADGPFIVLAPGLAFSESGERLGRGRAYYDRFLASLDPHIPHALIGICMKEQLCPHIPVTYGDRRMDGVLWG
jgi:5-formyltetrahydrofolate cyclo-ligase